jgi:type I restriction enzyme R subunit
VAFYENLRSQVKLHSGDAVDLKRYEPALRHLIDAYIRAEESEKVSAFDDLSLVQLIVERGPDAVSALPAGIRRNQTAVAETIENNVRKLILDENPINPKYYDRMSQLLSALIEQRRQEAIDYQDYLRRIVDLTRQVKDPEAGRFYPGAVDTPCRRTPYDNLDRDELLARAVDRAVRQARQDDWRGNKFKIKRVRNASRAALERPQDVLAKELAASGIARERRHVNTASSETSDQRVDRILELVKNQHEY